MKTILLSAAIALLMLYLAPSPASTPSRRTDPRGTDIRDSTAHRLATRPAPVQAPAPVSDNGGHMRARRHAIIASVATGAALEFVVGAIGGRREAWDSALYWSAGLPAALAAAAAIGYFAGRRAWYWTGLIMPSQVMVMMLRGGVIQRSLAAHGRPRVGPRRAVPARRVHRLAPPSARLTQVLPAVRTRRAASC